MMSCPVPYLSYLKATPEVGIGPGKVTTTDVVGDALPGQLIALANVRLAGFVDHHGEA